MRHIIENVRFIQEGTLVFGDLYIVDGFVERIDYKTVNGSSDIVIPGFVDIHTHGFRGYEASSCDPQELIEMATQMAMRGIVGFVPTIADCTLDEVAKIIDAYRIAFEKDVRGAKFLGVHMEGPYLSKKKSGAIDPNKLSSIDVKELETFLREYAGDIAIMSIAPELEGALELIDMLKRFGIVISLGHSLSTYEECEEAINRGAQHATHLGNAMLDLNHRKAGMIDAIFNANIKCELICDGIHNDKRYLKWLIKMLGFDRIMVISDGTKHCGFDYPQQHVLEDGCIIQNGAVFKDGILQGSTRDILSTLPMFYREFDYSIHDIIKITSINASNSMKLPILSIALGKKLDFIVLDHNLELKTVIINGRKIK